MLDVLVARIAPGFAFASSAANSAALRVEVLEDRLDDRRRRARRRRRRRPGSAGRVASRTRRGSAAARAKSFAARPIAGASRSAFWSCSVTVRPRSAHHAAMSPPIVPAPTTCTCARLEVAFLAERLQALLQPEHADQVGGGRRLQQRRHRRRIGRRRGERIAVVLHPQVEDRVRRRIVLAPRALRDLLSRLRGDESRARADSASATAETAACAAAAAPSARRARCSP